MAKSIYQIIIETYPELESSPEFINGSILLQNDSDGKGDYVAKWDYPKPIPEGLTIGKPE